MNVECVVFRRSTVFWVFPLCFEMPVHETKFSLSLCRQLCTAMSVFLLSEGLAISCKPAKKFCLSDRADKFCLSDAAVHYVHLFLRRKRNMSTHTGHFYVPVIFGCLGVLLNPLSFSGRILLAFGRWIFY